MTHALDLNNEEIAYLCFIIKGDLETLADTEEFGSFEDTVERVVAERLLDKLQEHLLEE